jgi:uroporphyrin-III C-methyltransferase
MNGKVYLIGAGPGDPELLTLKAVRRLGEADVVLVDALVDRAVLRHARRDARIMSVGKRAGCRSTPQRFIERAMIRLARRGCIVVRLKGGDPYVFGRGGEEAGALITAGVDVEVVNGVSAGIAAPAAAGIPVTQRGIASGVTFVTAHTADGVEPEWAALARTRTTLVVFMAAARLPGIAQRLMAGGMPGSTAVAIIERATCANERVVRTTLAQLPVRASKVESPATVVIGDVAALALAPLDGSRAIDDSPARHAA